MGMPCGGDVGRGGRQCAIAIHVSQHFSNELRIGSEPSDVRYRRTRTLGRRSDGSRQ